VQFEDPKEGKKWKGLVWLAIMGVLAFVSANGLPTLAKHIPWSWELHLNRVVSPLEFPECHPSSPEAEAVFKKFTDRLFPLMEGDEAIPLSIHWVHRPDVNAFASLGGQIYVFSGLLQEARSGDEVAGVLAHEITHVRERHLMQAVLGEILPNLLLESVGFGHSSDRVLLEMMNLKFSRMQEAEADQGALQRLQKAHVSAQGFADFFQRLSKEKSQVEWLSDHPSSESRAELARKSVDPLATPVLSSEEWKTLQSECRN
jgi:predicted Zn-dependent protease